MNLRQAVLHGAKAAESLHRKLGTQERVLPKRSSVDVFAVIADLKVPMLFRPLEKLLGAYLPDPVGIMITTERPLTIQRFTGAHELGHFWCRHSSNSLDDERIVRGSPFLSLNQAMEAEANSFAAHFLMPNWLMRPIVQQIAAVTSGMDVPTIVYQTSLRLGCSYEATWRTLQQHRAISPDQAAQCDRTPPKSIKVKLAPGLEVESWRSTDVWLLTEEDEGREVYAEPDDIFIVRLRQQSGAGFLWDTEKLKASGFVLLRDKNIPASTHSTLEHGLAGSKDPDLFVGNTTREFWLTAPSGDRNEAAVEMRRPWVSDRPSKTFSVHYSVFGPETSGYSRAERERRGYRNRDS